MSWLIAFIAFALLVILHEWGHFVAAKAVGMRVERFALFFPPLILRKRFGDGETEYAVGALPLGGYVKITGMNPEEDFPPEVAGRAYCNQPVWKRIVVIAAGPLVNLLIALIVLWGLYATAGATVAQVGEVEKGSPAVGKLQKGDYIVAVDGRYSALRRDEEIPRRVAEYSCAGKRTPNCRSQQAVEIVVRRDGERRTEFVQPYYDAERDRMRLGVKYGQTRERERYAVLPALGATAADVWYLTKLIATLPVRIFDAEERKDLQSAVGGYESTRRTLNYDVGTAIQIIALISLSLALFNLFPFLPLDGGHIFWALAEKVKGSAIPVRVLERASMIGIALVLMLFTIGLQNDIQRFQNGGFGP